MLNPVLRHADQAQKHARSAPWAVPRRVSRYRAPAAQGFDQRAAGSQLPAAYAQGRALIAERSGLRHDDAQIADDPGLVLIECDSADLEEAGR